MKNIFITSFHSIISRNILMAGVAKDLSSSVRVVLFVPEAKKKYFVEEFSGDNIVIEGVDTTLTRQDIFFRKLILAFSNTRGLYIKKRAELFKNKNYLSFLFYITPAFLFRNTKFLIKIVNFIDMMAYKKLRFQKFFKLYNPDVIFSTDLQNELDVRMIQEAKKLGVKSTGMIRSWDNITSKGLLRALPDKFAVHNEIIKKELIKYVHVSPEIIDIVGAPHHDSYVMKKTTQNRSEFFEMYDLDLNKKIILFSPIGNRYIRDNKLDALVLETLSEIDANIFVRMPPADTAELKIPANAKANIIFDHTGTHSWADGKSPVSLKSNEVSRADEEKLINTLAYADVVITGQSTMVIDASIFDVPSIVICFDQEKRNYYDSVKRYYDYEYYQPILKSEGVRFAKNADELKLLAKEYLKNPEKDSDGRKKIKEDQVLFLDGESTKRLVNSVLSLTK